MGGKTEADYTAVFKILADTIAFPPNLKKMMVDFELALHKGLQNHLGKNFDLKGCDFHFTSVSIF